MADSSDAWDAERKTDDAGERLRALAGEALQSARELVAAEVSLAKVEVKNELKRAALAAVLAVLSVVLLHAGFLVLVATVILTFLGQPLAAGIVGVILLALAVGAGLAAVVAFKHRHLPRTRTGLSRDVAVLRLRHES